jgi:hypothetical protein
VQLHGVGSVDTFGDANLTGGQVGCHLAHLIIDVGSPGAESREHGKDKLHVDGIHQSWSRGI